MRKVGGTMRKKTWIVRSPAGRRHVFCRRPAEELIPSLDGKDIAALLTDPLYCSGGTQTAQRTRPTGTKYIRSSGNKYKDFPGDSKDQRSWFRWVRAWLADLWQIAQNDTYAMVFTDWRQSPTLTDAFQVANWSWRGVAVWDKTQASRMPHKGYFRHQAEYIVWGTAGRLKARKDGPAVPGVLRKAIDSRKVHATQKPVEVLTWLLSVLHDRSGVVVDPFAGSGSTLLAAEHHGRQAICSELDDQIAKIALERFRAAGYRTVPVSLSSALEVIP